MPEDYEIRVQSHLDDAWATYFPGLDLMRLENGETRLSGSLADQSALHGVLERIRDLNLTLVAVLRCTPPEVQSTSNEEKP